MTRSITTIAIALLLCSSTTALAEIDLSGSWQSINHEDALERGAGPNPDDWAGLPFNDSGRAKALSTWAWATIPWTSSSSRPARSTRQAGRGG